MSNPYKFLDPTATGILTLDSRCATTTEVLTQSNGTAMVAIGVRYTWQQVNWQPTLRMQPETPGFAGWEVEHEFVNAQPSTLFCANGTDIATVLGSGASTLLIATNLNTSSYCPNNYGIQGVIGSSSVFCTSMASVSTPGSGTSVIIQRDSLSKSSFFVKRPDTYQNVSVTMFVPTTGTTQLFGPITGVVNAAATDSSTSSTHTFTFKCIRQKL